MSSMDEFNSRLPSSADSLEGAKETLSNKVSEGTEAVREATAEAGERVGEFYQRSNEVLASRVDPVVGIALAALAGYFVGYMVGTDRRH